MISRDNLGSIAGAPVVGADDERIGTVGQILVDPVTGSPNWVTVQTGLFGRHETFVPLQDASWDREVLHVPYDKALVKDAPRIDTEGPLDPEVEVELSRYYGLEAVEHPDAVPERTEDRDAPETAWQADAQPDTTEAERADQERHEEPLDPNRKGRHRA